MKKSLITTVLLMSFMHLLVAQQIPVFTQNRENAGYLNPAALHYDYIMYEKNINIGLTYRNQFTAINNAPKTFSLHGDYLYSSGSGVSILTGATLINDVSGPLSYTGLYGKFAGVISSDPLYSGLSFGLHGGLVQYKLDPKKIQLLDPSDITFLDVQNKLFPDVGLGVFYYQTLGGGGVFDEDKIYGGVSVPQVLGLNLNYKDDRGNLYLQRLQHFYAQMGMIKFFNDKESYLEPTIWLKYVPNVPLDVDCHLRYNIQNVFWLGAGYSLSGNGHAEIGLQMGEKLGFDQLIRITYGYDHLFNDIGSYTGSSHEISISVSLEKS
ncbi:MAG: PorP/SprF family type IX secretion system membrane protein [Saprospiraceae bacterium]|nr:PorP/SprF family type IX secretion system membrane protein [Saprospiraceae bacterium]